MTGQYPCGTCKIEVKNEDESVQCDLCDKWSHAFCVDISSAEMPFSSLSNREFNIFLSRNHPRPSAQAVPSKKIDI